MRILINAVSAVAGGGMTYLVNLLKYLPTIMPNDQFLVVIQGISLPKEFYEIPNLTIKKVSQKTSSENILKRYWWENTSLLKLCKQWKADTLYCIANMMPLTSSLVAVKTVTMIQNVAPLTPKVFFYLLKYEGIKPFFKMLANGFLTLYAQRNSDKTIVLSKATKQLTDSIIPSRKTEIIYHGIDTDRFNNKAPNPAKDTNEPYFIYVSNLYVYKGLEYIVEAYKNKSDLPPTYIAGSPFDSKYVKQIKNSIQKNNLENKIMFLDSVAHTELPKWYANAISMVYTSWCENCPNILLEAQACGCPVVAMNIGPMPELCSSDNILVEPFSGAALAEGMEKAIELRKDKDLSRRLIEHTKSFTWENSMKRHSEVFKE